VIHSRANIDKIMNQLKWEPKINVLDWIKTQL